MLFRLRRRQEPAMMSGVDQTEHVRPRDDVKTAGLCIGRIERRVPASVGRVVGMGWTAGTAMSITRRSY
jgi:hypothetical protein